MKNKIIMIIASISLLIGCLLLWNWIDSGKHGKSGKQEKKENVIPQVDNLYEDADIRAVVIPAENNTFGYNVYVNDAVLIHQPSRPGPSG